MLKSLFPELIKVSVDAGKAILDVYNTDFSVEHKDDKSPLTKADLASHHIINDRLQELSVGTSTVPVLSEESGTVPYETRRNWDTYWLIDPLDGTKEFVKKNGEFTVNIALIKDGIPIAGFVYVPVTDLLYFGSEDSGAWQLPDASACDPREWESAAFALAPGTGDIDLPGSDVPPLKVVASRSHLNEETQQFISGLEKKYGLVERVSSGSSIKLCLVASGEADVYPRFAPTMEWDTAAADAVCRAAGVAVIQAENRQPLCYNKENLLNPWFLVAKPGIDI